MLIIYRKSDGLIASNSGTNSFLPGGPPFELEVANAITAHGGAAADYGEYRLHDVEQAELVHAILQAGSYELQFQDNQPVGVTVYPRLSAEVAPHPAEPVQTVTVTATLPEGSTDTEVTFAIEDVFEATEPVTGGQAGHLLEFTEPGTYYVEVSSQRHGRITVEVVVVEPES